MLQEPRAAEAIAGCLNDLGVGVAIVEGNRVVYASPALVRLAGRTQEDLQTADCAELFGTDLSLPFAGPQPAALRRAGHPPVPVLVSARALGASGWLLLVIEDPSGGGGENYRELVEQALLGIYHSRPDGTIVWTNQALCRMLGYERAEDLLATRLDDIYADPGERRRLIARYEAERRTTIEGVEVRWKRRDGEPILVRLSGRAAFSGGTVTSFQVIVEDVTASRRLEETLQQTDRVRAMGQLAAGVAHDFNNLLTVILGHAELLVRQESGAETLESASQIERAARSAAGLTRQLLAFSRQQELQPATIDVVAAVADAERLLQTILRESIALAMPAPGGPFHIEIDPIQFEQILFNLAKNAADAMPGGGTLSIDVARADLARGAFGPHLDVHEGAYVELSVRDTGHGMDARTKARIFEPFFSTKPAGQGTGLGLATVYGIVKQSGGFIFVDSAPGVGTRFRVYFPEARAAGPDAARARTAREGSPRLLVVLEDAGARRWAASALARLGYAPLEASSAEEALDLAAAYPAQCLVSGLRLGDMSGPELHRRIAARDPAVKALFLARRGDPLPERAGDLWLLEMPCTTSELGRRVSDLLNEHRL